VKAPTKIEQTTDMIINKKTVLNMVILSDELRGISVSQDYSDLREV